MFQKNLLTKTNFKSINQKKDIGKDKHNICFYNFPTEYIIRI